MDFYIKTVLSVFFIFFHFSTFSSKERKQSVKTISLKKYKELNTIPYVWSNLRMSHDFKELKTKYKKVTVEKNNLIEFIFDFLWNQKVLEEHFVSSKIKANQEDPNFKNKMLKYQIQFLNLLGILEQGSFEEIKTFMENHKFNKADKIISVIFLTQQNRFGESILNFIESLGLSVSDTLSFKDLKSSIIPEKLIESPETLTVLHYHLVQMKDLNLLKRLLNNKEYNPNTKNFAKWNILHALLHIDSLNEIDYTKYIQRLDLILEHHPKSFLNEQNILGHTPLAHAILLKNQIAIDILIHKKQNLNIKDIFDQSIKQLLSHNFKNKKYIDHIEKSDLWIISPSKNTLPEKIVSIDLQPFFETLLESAIRQGQNPKASYAIANHFLYKMNTLEGLRMYNTYETLQLNKNNIVYDFFTAIFNRDVHFFTNNIKEKQNLLNKTAPSKGLHLDLLLESIRYSFLPGIKFLLEDYKSLNFDKQDHYFKTFEPLNLSIITYASLPLDHPLKSSAKEVFEFVARHIYSPKHGPYFETNFEPMFWATFLGLKEQVQFLHENKNMEIIEGISFPSDLGPVQISSLFYTEKEGFFDLNKYMKKVVFGEACKKIFFH